MEFDLLRATWRGKRLDNGEWVQGFYSCVTDNYTPKNVHCITSYKVLDDEVILTGTYSVDPKTLGDYARLIDKNNTPVFDGDVVKDQDGQLTLIKNWNDVHVSFACVELSLKEFEIVGNIYDNPSLRKTLLVEICGKSVEKNKEKKPCPFCGSTKIKLWKSLESVGGTCMSCGASSGNAEGTERTEALAAWNRRYYSMKSN